MFEKFLKKCEDIDENEKRIWEGPNGIAMIFTWVVMLQAACFIVPLVLFLLFGLCALVCLPVFGILDGDLEYFLVGSSILAVFAAVFCWYIASVRRERRKNVPPPLPKDEKRERERKEFDYLWEI